MPAKTGSEPNGRRPPDWGDRGAGGAIQYAVPSNFSCDDWQVADYWIPHSAVMKGKVDPAAHTD